MFGGSAGEVGAGLSAGIMRVGGYISYGHVIVTLGSRLL